MKIFDSNKEFFLNGALAGQFEHTQLLHFSGGPVKLQIGTFHAPSFGEDFEASMMQSQMMSQQAHHMDQYQMQMQSQQMQDQQYNMWQQQQPDPSNQMYNMTNPMCVPQMNSQMNYGVYEAQQQMQPPTMQSQPNLHYQQSPQQQSQMLMMPPPYKSPPMNAQQQAPTHQQIMSSPNMAQSPHYPVPAENGTTSEDSDGSVNTLKRPSPEPLNDSPSNAGKNGGTTATGAAKKPKPPRKKKKKDPNERQKPVSAYALFFRDTQAAIKGQNPNASFGEVSTIVASMWDALGHEHKEVYKKKTEAAKKEYLKTLAVYRASIVSKGNDIDQPNKPSTPTGTSNSPQSNPQSSSQTSLPVQQSPSSQSQLPVKQDPIKSDNPSISDHQLAAQLSSPQNPNLSNQQQQQQQQQQYGSIPGMPAPNPQNVPQQQISQASPYQTPYNNTQNAYKSPPNANHIDYNKMNMPMSNQMHPSAPPNQQQPMSMSQPQAPMHPNYGYEQQQQQQCPPQNANHHPYGSAMIPPPYNSSPMDNMNMQQNSYVQQMPNNGHQPPAPIYGNEGGYTSNPIQLNQVYNPNSNLNQQPIATPTMQAQQCIRVGCPNQAVMHPDWEDEYCSSECVVSFCRDVFNDWVQVQTNNANIIQQNNSSVVK